MYVCICNAVTEKDIQRAVKQGVCSMESLSAVVPICTQCGCCADYAGQVLEQAMNTQT